MKLRAETLIKRYGKRTVVKGVSLEVKQGEIVGLLGPNGAGKTTTFYMTVGLIKPNDGTIFLEQEDITALPMYKRAQKGIGYLPQEASVFRKLTVEDNIMAVLEMTRMSKAERKKKLEELLDEFSLHHVRTNRGDLLSGGERRRTEIARALAVDPKFILLDEPFAGVDPIAVEDIQSIVSKLKYRNIGILITDHNVQETLSITDRAYLLFEGNILLSGTPVELASDPKARELYLGKNFVLPQHAQGHNSLETRLDAYKDFELAFMVEYVYPGASDESKKTIDKVVKNRFLTPELMGALRTNALSQPFNPKKQCPRCRSSKLKTTQVELTRTGGSGFAARAAALDGMVGKATMVDRVDCTVCGYCVEDPNE